MNRLRRSWMGLLVVAGLASAGIAAAQPSVLPGNAQSVLYFPHLNEGGPDQGTFWQAEFVFVNTNSVPANLTVSFYNDDGSPMMIDFDAGPVHFHRNRALTGQPYVSQPVHS